MNVEVETSLKRHAREHAARPTELPQHEVLQQVAVVVGIGTYRTLPPLANASRAATDVAELLAEDYGFDVRERGAVLLDDAAGSDAVRVAIERSLEQAAEHSRWLFYFAGHGADRALVLADAERDAGLSLSWLRQTCLEGRCAEILVLLDLCSIDRELTVPVFSDWLKPGPTAGTRIRQLIIAGAPGPEAFDDRERGRPRFTAGLLDALEGWAGIHQDAGNGGPAAQSSRTQLRFTPLKEYLQEVVPGRDPALGWVLGGNLVGHQGAGFTFEATAPRIPAHVVRGTRDRDLDKRLESLRRLAHDAGDRRRGLRLAVRLAAQGLAGGPIEDALGKGAPIDKPDARVRAQAATTLGELAASETAAGELKSAEPLVHLALRDSAAAVRHRARRSLRQLPPACRQTWVTRLRTLRDRVSGRPRRRIRRLLVTLPEGLRGLSPADLAGALLGRSGLALAAVWWWLIERPLRRRLTAGLALAPAVVYAGLGATYHLGTPGRSVVVRWGPPGFAIAPGIGSTAVVTDFEIHDFADPRPLLDGRPIGLWLPPRGGMLRWGWRLGELLPAAEAGLAFWRWGQTGEAFKRLDRGLAASEGACARALAYLAICDPAVAERAIDRLLAALAEPAPKGKGALSSVSFRRPDRRVPEQAFGPEKDILIALAAVRDARPGVVALGSLGARLEASDGIEAVAAIEAAIVFGDGDHEVQRAALEKALALLESLRPTSELEARIGRALQRIHSAQPQLAAAAVPRLVGFLRRATPANRLLFLTQLELPPAVDREQRRRAEEALLEAARGQDTAIRTAAIEILGRQLAVAPAQSPRLAGALVQWLADPAVEIRLAAAQALVDLPAGLAQWPAIVEQLSVIAGGDAGHKIRSRAITLLYRVADATTAPAVVPALIAAAGDVNNYVRDDALEALGKLVARDLADAASIEPVLRVALADPEPWIRQEAARGLILFADRLTGDLDPALAAIFGEHPADPHRLAVTGTFGQALGEASPDAALIVARQSLPYLQRIEPPRTYLLRQFISGLLVGCSDRLASLAPAVIDLLAQLSASDPQREQTRAWQEVYSLVANLPAAGLDSFVDELLAGLHKPSAVERQAAAVALGWAVADHPESAERAVPALARVLGDPALAAGTAAADALALVGLSSARSTALRALVEGLDSPEWELRAACGRAVARLTTGVSPPAEMLGSAVVGALEDPEPAVRRAAARALGNLARHGVLEARDIAPAIDQRLALETDPGTRGELAIALAIVAGHDPAVVERTIRIARSHPAGETRSRTVARVLLSLGRSHPAAAGRALEALGDELSADRAPFPILRAIRELGAGRPAATEAAFAVLSEGLRAEGDPGLRGAIAGALAHSVLARPWLATQALQVLDQTLGPETIRDDYLAGMRDDPSVAGAFSLARMVEAARFDAGAIAVLEDPSLLWPRLTSPSRRERALGRRMLLRLLEERPDLEPSVRCRLRELRLDLRPQVRHGAALASEMLAILRITEASLGDAAAARRWSEILAWMRRRGVDETVRAAQRTIRERHPPATRTGELDAR